MSEPEIVSEPPGVKSRELGELRNKYVARGAYNVTPIFAAEAKGAVVKDVDGNTYIDFAGGIGVQNVGHCHPEVVEAVKQQVERFIHTCWHVVMYEPYVRLAEKLVQLTPGAFPKKVLLTNSGAEAVENMVKIAKSYTKKLGIITFEHAFHGRTLLTMGVTSKIKPYKLSFGPYTQNIHRFPYAYCYRCAFGLEYPSCNMQCVEFIRNSFITYSPAEETAAILVEPVQGEGGFLVPPKEFLLGLKRICDENELLLLDDEVQCGNGRTGMMWAVEHWGIIPDIMCTAKSIAAGFPLSAVIGKAEIMDTPQTGGLGGTYAGNPVACASAIKSLEIIQRSLENAQKIGETISGRLKEMEEKYEIIGDVRGLGPMQAMELVKDRKTKEPAKNETKKIVEYCYKNGLITIPAGTYDNVIRILVPIVADGDIVNRGMNIIENAVKTVSK